MVILRTRNKITDFLMILAWASPFNTHSCAKLVGKLAFGTRAPELCNNLPLNIRTISTLQSFKQTLKTRLFQSAYRLL